MPMQLYVSYTSPYARMARIMVLEKGLEDRVEVIKARTREAGSPYYEINPSGRIPFLITDDGVGLEDSALVCAYLDHLDGSPAFNELSGPEGWEARRLRATAGSMLDGVAVWGRELRRPEDERSPTILGHERDRSQRMADLWEREIDHPMMRGDFSMAQLVLIAALQMEVRGTHFRWRDGRPKLTTWADHLAQRPSVAATISPPVL